MAPRLQTYAVLLRGINVGGRTRVSMADLRALLGDLDVEDARTHLQSGNVVLESRMTAAALSAAIEKAIERELGLKVRVVVRTKAELAKIVSRNPFADAKRGPKQLHVAFLADKPSAARVRELDPEYAAPDEFRVAGREIYLHYPKGYGRTKINNAYFEKKLGVAATTRNWSTVTKLADLAGA